MTTFEILSKAIQERKSVSFQYNKKGVPTNRIGNPYVLYLYVSKLTRRQDTKLAFVQTHGDSDSKKDKPFPSFRDFLNIEDILNVQILEDQPVFGPPYHIDYNPESERYINVLIKI